MCPHTAQVVVEGTVLAVAPQPDEDSDRQVILTDAKFIKGSAKEELFSFYLPGGEVRSTRRVAADGTVAVDFIVADGARWLQAGDQVLVLLTELPDPTYGFMYSTTTESIFLRISEPSLAKDYPVSQEGQPIASITCDGAHVTTKQVVAASDRITNYHVAADEYARWPPYARAAMEWSELIAAVSACAAKDCAHTDWKPALPAEMPPLDSRIELDEVNR